MLHAPSRCCSLHPMCSKCVPASRSATLAPKQNASPWSSRGTQTESAWGGHKRRAAAHPHSESEQDGHGASAKLGEDELGRVEIAPWRWSLRTVAWRACVRGGPGGSSAWRRRDGKPARRYLVGPGCARSPRAGTSKRSGCFFKDSHPTTHTARGATEHAVRRRPRRARGCLLVGSGRARRRRDGEGGRRRRWRHVEGHTQPPAVSSPLQPPAVSPLHTPAIPFLQ